jgi:hypothetical protein
VWVVCGYKLSLQDLKGGDCDAPGLYLAIITVDDRVSRVEPANTGQT